MGLPGHQHTVYSCPPQDSQVQTVAVSHFYQQKMLYWQEYASQAFKSLLFLQDT